VANAPGVARLAQAHIGLIKDHAPQILPTLLLGTIQTGGALLVDGQPAAWPVSSYLVLEQGNSQRPLVVPLVTTTIVSAHSHDVPAFGEYLPYAVGDRVLVALLHAGRTPVVIGRCRVSA